SLDQPLEESGQPMSARFWWGVTHRRAGEPLAPPHQAAPCRAGRGPRLPRTCAAHPRGAGAPRSGPPLSTPVPGGPPRTSSRSCLRSPPLLDDRVERAVGHVDRDVVPRRHRGDGTDEGAVVPNHHGEPTGDRRHRADGVEVARGRGKAGPDLLENPSALSLQRPRNAVEPLPSVARL